MFFVIFFTSFHTFPEKYSFYLSFVVPLNTRGGLGAPLGAPRWALRRPEAASNCLYFVGFKGIIANCHGHVLCDLFYVFSDIP